MPFHFARRSHLRVHPAAAPIAALTVAVIGLSGCSGSSGSSSSSSSASSAAASASATVSAGAASSSPSLGAAAATEPVRTTKIGVKVTGNVGDKPALTVPTSAAPKDLAVEVLVQGEGKAVAKGDSLIGNYLGQTWKPKDDGEVNIFDNSWDRMSLAAFQIGTGKVIKGWDDALVGRKVGSRLLISVPAAQAYGATPNASNALAGQDLLFVVDIVDALGPDVSASGTVQAAPDGYPAVSNVSGKEPSVTNVAGVTAPKEAKSAVLIEGKGAPIEAGKQLALQYIQTDTATGKQSQGTWGKGVEVVPTTDVLKVAGAFAGKKVGSRVIALTPEAGGNASVILIVDVVGQYS